MMRFRSITLRLTLLFSTASAIVLLVSGFLVGRLLESHFEAQDLTALDGKLELFRHTLARVREPDDLAAVPREIADALVGHHDLYVSVIGPDRRVLYASPGTAFPASLIERFSPVASTLRVGPLMWSQGRQRYRGIAATVPTALPGQPPAIVALALNIEEHRTFMAAFRKNLSLGIAVGLLLTVLLGWIAARRGLAPIRDMVKLTQRISAKRLSDRLPPESVPTELADLAIAFNAMLARLEDSFRRLSDFSSDLAHELRTPISNLMTHSQVMVSRARSADEYREVLYSNLEEYERLARMISDMLFLAKADNELITPGREKVDLATQVNELFGFYEPLADERGVALTVVDNGTVEGDRLMIRRAISNLLSNAIRHTARNRVIRVLIEQRKSGETELAVENPGETIAPEHLPRLFDRFYRVDPSRHRESDGAGLGLAITESIIAAHGGTIRVSSMSGSTRFTICFPARQSDHLAPAPAEFLAKRARGTGLRRRPDAREPRGVRKHWTF